MATPNILNDKASLVISTLDQLNKGEWFQEMQTQQDYPMTRLAMASGKEETGKRWTVHIADDFGEDDCQVPVGPVEVEVDIGDYLSNATGEWRKLIASEGFSTEVLAWNSGPEQVLSELEIGTTAMRMRIVNAFERTWLNIPSTNEALKWNGMAYYVPWKSTALGSFHSGLPVGATTILGIDPALNEKWRSYADTYTTFNRDDIALKLWKMARLTNFMPPPMVKGNATNNFRYYGTGNATDQLKLMQLEANDAPGYDVFGPSTTLLRGSEVVWLPQLDNEAASNSDPLYQINHGPNGIYPVFSPGFKFKFFPAEHVPKMRTTIGLEVHVMGNWKCNGRRRQGVIAKSAPFGES